VALLLLKPGLGGFERKTFTIQTQCSWQCACRDSNSGCNSVLLLGFKGYVSIVVADWVVCELLLI
jgi:hypothetical protein